MVLWPSLNNKQIQNRTNFNDLKLIYNIHLNNESDVIYNVIYDVVYM